MENQENKLNPRMEDGWKNALAEEFGAEYMKELKKKLVEEMKAGIVIYPPAKQILMGTPRQKTLFLMRP